MLLFREPVRFLQVLCGLVVVAGVTLSVGEDPKEAAAKDALISSPVIGIE